MRFLIDTNIFFETDRELIQQHITKTTTAYDKKRLKGGYKKVQLQNAKLETFEGKQ